MTLLALGLIVASAVCHATWNLLAKQAGGGAAFVWLFGALAAVIYGPLAVLVIVIQRPEFGLSQLVFLGGSVLLHMAYFLLLQQGYRVGDLSVVYPLARGTGPMLSTIGAVLLLGEQPGALGMVGAGLVVLGIFLMTGSILTLRSASSSGLGFGLLTGVLIASYTLWDKQAVGALAIPPLVLDWSLSVGRAVVLAPVARRRWDEVRRIWREARLQVLGVAVLSPLAYILVLTALTFTPVSYVAPAREISILIGTIFGARLLAEGEGLRRVGAASVLVLGVAVLALA